MKININNKVKKIFEKIFRKETKKEAKLIKFNVSLEDENAQIEQEVKTRVGANAYQQEVKNNVSKKRARKIFIGMVMMLLLTTSLNLRYENFFKVEEYEPKDISSVTVSTNIENNQEFVTAVKAEEKIVTKKVEEKLVFWPALEGEVQKMYSTDKVIYSKTLQQWKTHDGIDISAANDTEVKAIEKGVVESVYNDSFYGMTIEIEHINGYRSVYSNLDSNVYVAVGESVIRGQKIGKVGNTSVGEYLDDPHLHFMLYFNDKSVNPTYIFE
ncbi:MAG: M23 family metallopeptidase [Clostridia bacterium]|nr:M23 family metallopeptidase [Clostridia bacterium]